MLCKGSERRSPSLLLYKRGSGWVLLLRRGGPATTAPAGDGPVAWPAVLMALTGLA